MRKIKIMDQNIPQQIIATIPWWAYLLGGGMGLSFLGLCILLLKTVSKQKNGNGKRPIEANSPEWIGAVEDIREAASASSHNEQTLSLLRDNIVRQTELLVVAANIQNKMADLLISIDKRLAVDAVIAKQTRREDIVRAKGDG